MAITTLDALDVAQKQAYIFNVMRVSQASTANTITSLWNASGNPGAGNMSIGNIVNGLVPDGTTAGAFPLGPSPVNPLLSYLSRFDLDGLSTTASVILYDRVWHAGSFSVTSLGTTTLTSIPAITRAPADWSELEMYVEVNAAISATATTVQFVYTNSAGTTGQTTPAVNINGWVANRMQAMPLQSGDTGVQQITGVIVGGTVASSGSINAVMVRRIASRSALSSNVGGSAFPTDAMGMGMRRVWDNSCLTFMESTSSTISGSIFATYALLQG